MWECFDQYSERHYYANSPSGGMICWLVCETAYS